MRHHCPECLQHNHCDKEVYVPLVDYTWAPDDGKSGEVRATKVLDYLCPCQPELQAHHPWLRSSINH